MATTTDIKITELEKQALENYVTNDYGDLPDHHTWSFAVAECGKNDISKAQISGVISSLVKKGLVSCTGVDKDASTYLTKAGSKKVYELFHSKYDWVDMHKAEYLES